MRNIRFYVVLAVVLIASVVLLGLSYSLPSGTSNYTIEEEVGNEMRVVYSNTNRLYIINQNKTDVGLTNLAKEEKTYAIFVEKEKGQVFSEVYCSIDGGEEVLLNATDEVQEVYRGQISAAGEDGDYRLHKVNIYSKAQDNAVYVIHISYIDDINEEVLEDASE